MANKLTIPPDQASYAVSDSSQEVIRVQLQGGAARYRRDILNSSKIVNVTWTADREEYDYLQMFYRVMTYRAGEPFKIDLIIGESGLTEHDARFVPGSWQLQNQKGHSYTVAAQLEVTALQYDYLYEDAIITFLSAYGSYSEGVDVINQFNQLVNIDLPSSIGV